MKLHMYSVFDKAVTAYMPPFFVRSAGEAVRSFVDAVNKEGSQFAGHAPDYALYYVGIWDDVAGTFEWSADLPSLTMQATEAIVAS